MDRCRVVLRRTAVVAAGLCVFGVLSPVLARDGGILEVSHVVAQCCVAPVPAVRPSGEETGRTVRSDAASIDGARRDAKAFHDIDRQRAVVSARHSWPAADGGRALDLADTRQDMPGVAVAGLTVGDVLTMAVANSGESSGAPGRSPAVSHATHALHVVSGPGGAKAEPFGVPPHGTVPGAGDPAPVLGMTPIEGVPGPVGALAADSAKPAGSAPSGSQGAGGTSGAQAPGGADASAPSQADTEAEFSGSAEPAGPDINPDEEAKLISRGWQ